MFSVHTVNLIFLIYSVFDNEQKRDSDLIINYCNLKLLKNGFDSDVIINNNINY